MPGEHLSFDEGYIYRQSHFKLVLVMSFRSQKLLLFFLLRCGDLVLLQKTAIPIRKESVQS